jgi:hypothetical protein
MSRIVIVILLCHHQKHADLIYNNCSIEIFSRLMIISDGGKVVRVPSCSPRSPVFDSRHYQIFCVGVGLERGPLSLMRINEELLERKVVAPV